jgi:hypothetical protein
LKVAGASRANTELGGGCDKRIVGKAVSGRFVHRVETLCMGIGPMDEKIEPSEEAIIAEIMRRRQLRQNEPTIPSEKVQKFKAILNEEFERTGALRKETVRAGEL